MHVQSFDFSNVIKDWGQTHKPKRGQTEKCIWKTEGKWFYTKLLHQYTIGKS